MSEVFRKKFTKKEIEIHANHVRKKFPGKLGVIVEPEVTWSGERVKLTKYKYLIRLEDAVTVGHLMKNIRKYAVDIRASEALFLSLDDKTLPPTSALVKTLPRDECGFLFLQLSKERTFGFSRCYSYAAR